MITEKFPFPAALNVLEAGKVVHTSGDSSQFYEWASVTKTLTTWAILVATSRGVIGLSDPVAGADYTLWHLLSHSAGFTFESKHPTEPLGNSRIYSNTGIERAAELVASRVGGNFHGWVAHQVLRPLGMKETQFYGSPAHGCRSTIGDLAKLCAEFMRPTLVPQDWVKLATNPIFPGLPGTVPGFGKQADNLWGLGFELHGEKDPHWMGAHASAQSFGHFGQAGSFIWVDPTLDVGAVFLGKRPFGAYHRKYWPLLNDQIRQEFAKSTITGT